MRRTALPSRESTTLIDFGAQTLRAYERSEGGELVAELGRVDEGLLPSREAFDRFIGSIRRRGFRATRAVALAPRAGVVRRSLTLADNVRPSPEAYRTEMQRAAAIEPGAFEFACCEIRMVRGVVPAQPGLALPHEAGRAIRDLCEGGGIELEAIYLHEFALARLGTEADTCSVLVDAGVSGWTIVIAQEGRPRFFRFVRPSDSASVPTAAARRVNAVRARLGLEPSGADQRVAEAIAAEISRTTEYAERSLGVPPVTRLGLLGGPLCCSAVCAAVMDRLRESGSRLEQVSVGLGVGESPASAFAAIGRAVLGQPAEGVAA